MATLHFGCDGYTVAATVGELPVAYEALVKRAVVGPDAGFSPGVVLVPEHHIAFVGAGMRIELYDLVALRQVWSDQAEARLLGVEAPW